MKEQNYNIENLGNTYYLFSKNNEHMISDIKKFALIHREKIALDLGLSEEYAGFMQKIIDNKIWADKTLNHNSIKNKDMPNNFLDYFLSWDRCSNNEIFQSKLIKLFLESQNLINDNWKDYFIISRTQLKKMLGGNGLVGAIKKEMKNEPLKLDIFDLNDRFERKEITEEQYDYFKKVEQNLFGLITHKEFFFTIIKIKNRVGIANETQFLKMVDSAKKTKFPDEASKFGNRTGFHKDLWKPTGNRNFF